MSNPWLPFAIAMALVAICLQAHEPGPNRKRPASPKRYYSCPGDPIAIEFIDAAKTRLTLYRSEHRSYLLFRENNHTGYLFFTNWKKAGSYPPADGMPIAFRFKEKSHTASLMLWDVTWQCKEIPR